MIKYLLLFLLLILSSCQQDGKKGALMDNGSVITYCVGRHFIVIPNSFEPSTTVNGVFQIDGAKTEDPELDIIVRSDVTTKANFDAIVRQRRSELSRSKSKTANIFELDKQLAGEIILFRVREIDDAYFSEMYFQRDSAMVKLRQESYNNSYLQTEEQMVKLAAAIKERGADAKGSVGFCLGPISVNAKFSQEIGNFNFADKSGLALEMEVDSFSRDGSTSLLSRMAGSNSLLSKFDVRHRVLRAGERVVAGMRADEWLGVTYSAMTDDQRILKFILEAKRSSPGKATPSITLTLDSAQPLRDGTRTVTKITDEEATIIWDRIVESIRFYDNRVVAVNG